MAAAPLTLPQLNASSQAEFTAALDGVYEHSPWMAEAGVSHYKNDRTLSADDISMLSAWADNGSPEGDAKDRPTALTFHDGWNMKPDIIVEMPKPFQIPASGTINYKFVLVKTNFPQDMWVQAAEMRAGNPKVLHHGKVWVRPPGSHWLENAEPGEAYENETQHVDGTVSSAVDPLIANGIG